MNTPTPTDREIAEQLASVLRSEAERVTPQPALRQILTRAHEENPTRSVNKRVTVPSTTGPSAGGKSYLDVVDERLHAEPRRLVAGELQQRAVAPEPAPPVPRAGQLGVYAGGFLEGGGAGEVFLCVAGVVG